MSAIQIKLTKTEDDLFCKSKWWGSPDLPMDFDFNDQLMFICQIRCEDLHAVDEKSMLPKKGMLYFFADIAYYLGYYEDFDPPYGHLWDENSVRVYYVDSVDEESFRRIVFDDDYFPDIEQRSITFEVCDDTSYGHKLLGVPSQFEYEDWETPCEGWINLLQLDSDEEDDYNLMFMDMGCLYFIINPKDLIINDFTKVKAYLYST